MSDSESEIIATAEELRAAVKFYAARRPSTEAELIAEWDTWFRKRAAKIFKDAAAKGLYRLTLDLPYQPVVRADYPGLQAWKGRVERMLPGCSVCFVEEDYEERVAYVLEVAWD